MEHVTFMTSDGVHADPDLGKRIAHRRFFVGTTVGVLPAGQPLSPAAAARRARIKQARFEPHAAGARMTAGSDAGIASDKPHDVLPYGMARLTDQIGMTPVQALQAATATDADACGLTTKGRLRPGTDADLLVVGGDPTRDMSASHKVRAAFRAGHRVNGTQDHGTGADR